MSLPSAIAQLEAEVEDYGHGTPRGPKEGTSDWFLLRAKRLALSSLRRASQLQLNEPAAFNRHYRAVGKLLKHEETEE